MIHEVPTCQGIDWRGIELHRLIQGRNEHAEVLECGSQDDQGADLLNGIVRHNMAGKGDGPTVPETKHLQNAIKEKTLRATMKSGTRVAGSSAAEVVHIPEALHIGGATTANMRLLLR